MRVSGLESRAVAGQSEIDLAGDLETLTPEGGRVNGLWTASHGWNFRGFAVVVLQHLYAYA